MKQTRARPGRLRSVVIVVVAVGAALLVTATAGLAQPGYDADQLEPGVLAPQDEPDYGVIPWWQQLEPGVLGPADEVDRGIAPPPRARLRPPPPRWNPDVLEPGVLGPADELESGLIGLDDPIFY
jgi:hypothetical protein